MAALLSTVVLRNPETGAVTALVAGEECPDWAVELITNPAVLEQAAEQDDEEKDDSDTDESDEKSSEDDAKGDEESTEGKSEDDAKGDEEKADAEPEKPKTQRSATKGK